MSENSKINKNWKIIKNNKYLISNHLLNWYTNNNFKI